MIVLLRLSAFSQLPTGKTEANAAEKDSGREGHNSGGKLAVKRISYIPTLSRTLTIHTLRKCCFQNWVDVGLPINVVKELMGHADIFTTQRYYCTFDETHKAKAAAIQNKILDLELDRNATDLKMTFSGDFAPNSGKREKQWSV